MKSGDEFKPVVDLLVIITRLHTKRGAADDEFLREWCLPKGDSESSGVLSREEGIDGFWVRSAGGQEGLVVLHGCDEFFPAEKGAFQRTVCQALKKSGFSAKKDTRLAVLAHGRIKETSADLGMQGDHRPDCSLLESTFHTPLLLGNYSLGDGSAALTVPHVLREAGIECVLIDMAQAQLKLEPAVDLAVRGMQHIVLEMRVWCDLYLNSRSDSADIEELFQDCCARLTDEDHWKNKAVTKVRAFETLIEFLEAPCENVVTDLLGKWSKHEPRAGNRIAEKIAALGGAQFLDSDSESLACIRDERLPERNADVAKVDRCLRALAARLELLIEAAAGYDKWRGSSGVAS